MQDASDRSAFVSQWATAGDRAETVHRRNSSVSLLARAALRALLAEQTGRSDWKIRRTALGKPFVVTPSGAPGPAISLSHTRNRVAVAIADDGALGIDIEWHRPRDFTALAAYAFGVSEQAQVAIGGAEAFYRIWTLREAVAKATGEGLALAGNGRDLLIFGSPGTECRTEHAGRSWHLAHLQITADCSVAVAHADTAEKAWAVRWIVPGRSTADPPLRGEKRRS